MFCAPRANVYIHQRVVYPHALYQLSGVAGDAIVVNRETGPSARQLSASYSHHHHAMMMMINQSGRHNWESQTAHKSAPISLQRRARILKHAIKHRLQSMV